MSVALSLAERIIAANNEFLQRIAHAAPTLTAVSAARRVIPALTEKTVLHAGPPVAVEALCGPMRGAIMGAAILEGWARSPDDAAALLDAGAIALRCTHDWNAVGPMAGIISPSMPVLEVHDTTSNAVAYCPINEGIGAVLRFGAYDDPVLTKLRWMQEALAPALDAALRRVNGVALIPLMARAVTMGDEMYQRNTAATGLFFRAVTPALAELGLPGTDLARILQFVGDNDQFFLNVAMAACKVIMAPAAEIRYCTAVSLMSRNGVEFGIRVSGLGRDWFTAPAPVPDGLYFPGFGSADANPDMGDSAIVETAGLGGFAMAAAPAVVGFVGLPSADDAGSVTRSMGDITLGASAHFKIPAFDFVGTPTGIDIRRVVELESTPIINTGIAHRRAGVGQIGAGVVRVPLEVFQKALAAFVERYAG